MDKGQVEDAYQLVRFRLSMKTTNMLQGEQFTTCIVKETANEINLKQV